MNKFYELSDDTLINLEEIVQVNFIEINEEDENGTVWEAGLHILYKNGATLDTKTTCYDDTRKDYNRIKELLI